MALAAQFETSLQRCLFLNFYIYLKAIARTQCYFLVFLLYFFIEPLLRKPVLRKNCLKDENYSYYYYDDERYKKVPFLSISVLQLFVC